MCDKQYDISEYMRKLFEEKQKQRLAAKTYYRNLLYNPHLPPDHGVPFDPAVQRYGAMSAYHADLIRPKLKHYAVWFLAFSPIIFFNLHLHYVKSEQEKLLRSGQVAYSDRKAKGVQ